MDGVAASDDQALLAAQGIFKSYGTVEVLHGIDFSVRAGEVHAVIGENGAGKSTLMKILSGFVPPSTGELFVDGTAATFHGVRDAEAAGIVLIHQEFNLAEQLTVEENIFLGRELHRGVFVDRKRMREQARLYLDQLHCSASETARVSSLSVAEKQMVEIAKAISRQARVLILDEPTAVLTAQETEVLYELIARLKAQGAGLVFISHKLDEVERVADRITVLRDGQHVCTEPGPALSQDDMTRLMVGRPLTDFFASSSAPTADAERVLEAEGIRVAGHVQQASFDLKKGEVLGFAGLQGSGRTALMEALVGLRPIEAGTLRINGKTVRFETPKAAKQGRVAYLTKDRKGKGLLLTHSLVSNFSLLALDKFARPFLDRDSETEAFRSACQRFDIRGAERAATAGNLSGGNQQKLLMAKVMEIEPTIVIIDEPTRGIDVGAKAQIYHFIADLVAQGRSVIVLSSELPEVIGLSHRIAVMHNGRLTGLLEGEEITEEEIMRYASGLKGYGNGETDRAA